MAATKLRSDSDIGRRVIRSRVESLTCELTADEKWDAALETCRKVVEYARTEAEKKHVSKTLTKKLKDLRKEIEDKAIEADGGRVDRDVTVEEVYLFAEEIVLLVRTDTGEVLSRRKPTTEERQEDLRFGGVQ